MVMGGIQLWDLQSLSIQAAESVKPEKHTHHELSWKKVIIATGLPTIFRI
jgi:hypothetical protein